MDLFEYQGKQYFARFGVPVSPGGVATTPDEAVELAEGLGYPVVVKAQVQVGGRGKAGGIKLAGDADEARAHAAAILGMDIGGHVVRRIWLEHASDIEHEYYASFTLDRGAKDHLAMVSAKGGVDIEQVAADDPDAIVRLHVDPYVGFSEAQAGWLVPRPDWTSEARAGAAEVLSQPLPLLHRGRRRPGRDQPPGPYHRRPGACPRCQGHPGRQRRLPPS